MKIYIAGGFVRDTLLGLHPKDVDFVVAGATLEDLMLFGDRHNLSFQRVGANFPVFLDSRGREWALARKERNTGPGYHGFDVEFDPSVTIEEDLFRRDLTINAMAIEVDMVDVNGDPIFSFNNIIDPFDGRDDLHSEILVHVSDHFAEDPVRVLRIARFAARYGFKIADHTMFMLEGMVKSGELDHLVSERVWAELEKALSGLSPATFFDVLNDIGAMNVLFPGLAPHWTWNKKTQLNVSLGVEERMAILVHDMDPSDARVFCHTTIKMPKDVATFAMRFNLLLWTIDHTILDADQVERIFKTFDSYRNLDFFNRAYSVASHLQTGETLREIDENASLREKISCLVVLLRRTSIIGYDNLRDDQQQFFRGPEIGQAIQDLRKEVIVQFFSK